LLGVLFRDFFMFVFYKVIMFSWLKSLVLKINLIYLWSFLYLFFKLFFLSLNIRLLGLELHIFFSAFLFLGLSWFYIPDRELVELTWVDFGFLCFFFNLFFFNFILSHLWLGLWDRENLIGKKWRKSQNYFFKKKLLLDSEIEKEKTPEK